MVRSQDFFTVVQYISQNSVGNKLAWDWIRSNWDYLVNRWRGGILFYTSNSVHPIFFSFHDYFKIYIKLTFFQFSFTMIETLRF